MNAQTDTKKATTETLPVIFRVDKYGQFKGDVTAIFPTMPGDTAGRTHMCYAHVGQHGQASYNWYIKATRPAKPAEYAELLAELRDIYERPQSDDDEIVRLKVVQRMTQQHREAFDAELQRIL